MKPAIELINVNIRSSDGRLETKSFSDMTSCLDDFMEYLVSLGIYSSITIEKKFQATDIVMKRLKGE